MTTEKKLREFAAEYLRRGREDLAGDLADAMQDRLFDVSRAVELIKNWPILDLPVPDRGGCLWPLHGYAYGHVQRRGDQIVISRGDKPMHLTKGEALELAAILTAAAMEEA